MKTFNSLYENILEDGSRDEITDEMANYMGTSGKEGGNDYGMKDSAHDQPGTSGSDTEVEQSEFDDDNSTLFESIYATARKRRVREGDGVPDAHNKAGLEGSDPEVEQSEFDDDDSVLFESILKSSRKRTREGHKTFDGEEMYPEGGDDWEYEGDEIEPSEEDLAEDDINAAIDDLHQKHGEGRWEDFDDDDSDGFDEIAESHGSKKRRTRESDEWDDMGGGIEDSDYEPEFEDEELSDPEEEIDDFLEEEKFDDSVDYDNDSDRFDAIAESRRSKRRRTRESDEWDDEILDEDGVEDYPFSDDELGDEFDEGEQEFIDSGEADLDLIEESRESLLNPRKRRIREAIQMHSDAAGFSWNDLYKGKEKIFEDDPIELPKKVKRMFNRDEE